MEKEAVERRKTWGRDWFQQPCNKQGYARNPGHVSVEFWVSFRHGV